MRSNVKIFKTILNSFIIYFHFHFNPRRKWKMWRFEATLFSTVAMATSVSNRGIRHVAITGRPGWYYFRYRFLYNTCNVMSHSDLVNIVNREQTTVYRVYLAVSFVMLCCCFWNSSTLELSLDTGSGTWVKAQCIYARYLYILFI